MSLPISTIANVNITTTPKLASREGFGTLLGITSESGPIDNAELLRFYSNSDDVGTDFGTSSEIYKLASAYFSQSPSPTNFAVGMRYETTQFSTLYCVTPSTYTNVTTDLAGLPVSFSFTVTASGTPVTQEYSLTFGSSITTEAEAVAELQAAIDAEATQTIIAGYDTANSRFTFEFTGGNTAGDSIGFMGDGSSGTNLNTIIGGTQSSGYTSETFAPQDITAALNALYQKSDNWYGFAFTKEMTDAYQSVSGTSGVVEAAAWAESAAAPKVFWNQSYDNQTVNVSAANQSSVAKTLQTANYTRTGTTYSSDGASYAAASIAGYAFTWNPNSTNSHYTLKFKPLPGIPTEDLSANQNTNMNDVNANAQISIGGQSMYSEGVQASGDFFDKIHGIDWLENALETNIFNYLYSASSKRPASGVGQSGIEQALRSGLIEGVNNGFIGPGFGTDGTFYPEGFEITVPVLSQADKVARQSTGISFICIGTGALHGVVIEGVFEE